jgi:hypothetical protein
MNNSTVSVLRRTPKRINWVTFEVFVPGVIYEDRKATFPDFYLGLLVFAHIGPPFPASTPAPQRIAFDRLNAGKAPP